MRCPVSPSTSLLAVLLFCLSAGRAADGGATLRDAVAALERGDFPSAEQKLRAELVAHPSDATALSLLGVALDNQKKFREAAEAHRRAIANAPRSAGILHNYGNHLGMTGDDEGARKVYLQVVALDPANHDANLQLARLALKRKSGPEALGYLKRLPANRQEAPNVAVLRVEALYLAGNHADADALVARLTPAAQGDPGLSSSLGLALANAGKFDEAEAFQARALAAAPADFDVLYSLGVTASRAGHYQRARDVLETALRQQPQNVDVLYSLAYVIDALKQPEEAVRLLAQAARLAPQRADIQKALAIITTGLGANEDALAAWNRYLKLEPNDEFARRERGYSAVRLGQFEQGIADLQWFLARHPDDAVGYFQLGRAESEVDPAQAIVHLDKALALKPDFAPARSARGSLYYRMGKPEAAVTDFESAAALLPDDAIILDRLGQTYLALDRPADAVRVLRKAAELAPEDSKTLFHFGRALADVGQSAESKVVMDRFQQLGSNTKKLVPGGLVDYLSLTPDERRADYRARVESAVLKDPSDAAAQARYLKLSLEDGNSDQAAAAARQIAGLKPGPAVLAEAGPYAP